jgi:hypothetical protein
MGTDKEMQEKLFLEKGNLKFITLMDKDGDDIMVITDVKDGEGKRQGNAIRIFHPQDKSITFVHIDRGDLPSLIPHSPALVRNGVPFSTYVTLLQGGLAEFDFYGLQKIKLVSVTNDLTLLSLGMLMKRYPKTSINELIRHTHVFDYTETFFTQLGKDVQSIQVSKIFDFQKAGYVYKDKAGLEKLKAYQLTPDDKIPSLIDSIDIYLK